jgi:LuxR family transcriptional regulator, maltose regulon positive regulatory protein
MLEKACAYFETAGQKIQMEKANLYLTLAYGQVGNLEKLFEHLLKVLAYLDADTKPVSLIAAASRFQTLLNSLASLDYIHGQMEELFTRLEKFREQLPLTRRNLRQQAVAIPFAPPTIHIRALGKMQVKVGKRLVANSDWQTQAARDLFFMLLAHPEGMTKDEIGLIFWPDASPENVKFRIKNSIYRLRHAVGKDVILLEQNNYRFNNKLDYEYDVELFLRENARAQKDKDAFKRLTHFREAIKLYQGAYLPEIEDEQRAITPRQGTYLPEIDETWVHTPREALQQIYLNILLQISEIYMEQANFDLALEYCQRALKEDNCLETAYRLSFRIYAAMGNRAAVVRQYQRCREVLLRELNAEPSSQTRELYQGLLK